MFSHHNDLGSTLDYKSPINTGILFEQFIITILQRIANKNNQELLFHVTEDLISKPLLHKFDAFAPNGINNLRGEIYIEIKEFTSKKAIENLFKKFLEIFNEGQTLLIITKSKIAGLGYNINLIVWDKSKVDKLQLEYAIDAFNYLDSKPSISIDDFDLVNISNINMLKNVFKASNENLTLVLGSGVSISNDLPSWDDLLKYFLKKYQKQKK